MEKEGYCYNLSEKGKAFRKHLCIAFCGGNCAGGECWREVRNCGLGGKGRMVRPGCLLSSLLCTLYIEKMMEEAIKEIQEGIKVGGQMMVDVWFAYDQAIIASTDIRLLRIMNGLYGKFLLQQNTA